LNVFANTVSGMRADVVLEIARESTGVAQVEYLGGTVRSVKPEIRS